MANKTQMKNASDNALNKFFTQGTGTGQNSVQKTSTGISTQNNRNGHIKAKKKVQRVFSFRAESEVVAKFRAYCFAKYGMTVDQVGESAMIEYMNNHPLEKFEKELYQSKLAEEMTK